jgi:hypothetical protein
LINNIYIKEYLILLFFIFYQNISNFFFLLGNNFRLLNIIGSCLFDSGFVVIRGEDIKKERDHKDHKYFISNNKLSTLEDDKVRYLKTAVILAHISFIAAIGIIIRVGREFINLIIIDTLFKYLIKEGYFKYRVKNKKKHNKEFEFFIEVYNKGKLGESIGPFLLEVHIINKVNTGSHN